MTFTDLRWRAPKSKPILKKSVSLPLIISGQGVIIFYAKETESCQLIFKDKNDVVGLIVYFTKDAVWAKLMPSEEPLIDSHNSRGLSELNGAYYWFSLDSHNHRLYAGIGEARLETSIYTFTLPATTKSFLEGLSHVDLSCCQGRTLLRDPITSTIPLLVKNTDELTMDAVAAGTYMPKANLSLTSQKLYDCISGKKFTLTTPDFPDFVKAIEYSIATPGCWCHERLKQKATEFSTDKPNYAETYLRITLGENNGESPGIPYVMEIWPVGHYSPIHNHGAADAVIRVLNGSINVSLFAFLSGDITPFAKADFNKEDVTWISPTLNQVHQLKNLDGNKDTCITIQCYMYETEDITHHDYFDYIDDKGAIGYFDPDSDMEFLAFKALMKKEWAARRHCFRIC